MIISYPILISKRAHNLNKSKVVLTSDVNDAEIYNSEPIIMVIDADPVISFLDLIISNVLLNKGRCVIGR